MRNRDQKTEKCIKCYVEKKCIEDTACEGNCADDCPMGSILCRKFEGAAPMSLLSDFSIPKINLESFELESVEAAPSITQEPYQASNNNFYDVLDPKKQCFKNSSLQFPMLEKMFSETSRPKFLKKTGFDLNNRCPLQPLKCNRDRKGYGRFSPEVVLEKGLKYANQSVEELNEKVAKLVDALIVYNFENSTKIMGPRRKYKPLPEIRTNMKEVIGPFTEKSTTKIPNIYHMIWFSDERTFTFLNLAAIISILRFTTTEKLFFHTDVADRLEGNVYFELAKCLGKERFHVVNVRATQWIFLNLDKKKWMQFSKLYHQADFYRLLILIQFGGIYIDDDFITLKDIDQEILNLNIPTLSEESCISLSNGFIVSPPKATFLMRFFNTINDGTWRPQQYGEQSVIKLWALKTYFKNEVNVEKTRMVRPSNHERGNLFETVIDYRQNFNIHMSPKHFEDYKYFDVEKGLRANLTEELTGFECWDNTLGELLRHTLLGNNALVEGCVRV